MTPVRLRKRIARTLMVSWRDQPTRYDIEALQANVRRVGLVVRVRWMLIGVLALYSFFAATLYATRIPPLELAQLMAIPALTLGFVVLYNTFYALNYRRLGNIAYWNNLQLGLDALVVTVLVYFSGGVNSWFWSMYSLFILEAAFILPRSKHVWVLALGCVALIGGVEWAEFWGIVPHIEIPFGAAEIYSDPVYVSVRFLWQVAVLMGTAGVATALVGDIRNELTKQRSHSLIDEQTGLYSRSYFLRAMGAEFRRASREGRALHMILVDVDRFGDFNDQFGFDAGDRMLSRMAEVLAETIAFAGDVMLTTNVAARFGGEEFAVLLVEDSRATGGVPSAGDAYVLAEQARHAIEELRVEGAGVTVSIGIASAPRDAHTVDELLDATDAALSAAIEAGGNRTVRASDAADRLGED